MMDAKIQEQIAAGQLKPITKFEPARTNWQLFAAENEKVWSIAIVDGAKNTLFGDKWNLLKLMRQGSMNIQDLNEQGLEFLSGLHNRLIGSPGSGNEFWLLSL